MRLRDETIGALNLFGTITLTLRAGRDPGGAGARRCRNDRDLQERNVTHAEALTEQLQGALNSRIVIEQAKGALARSKGISVGAAFDTLRLEARSSSRRLVEVAQAVLDELEKDTTE